MPTARDLFDAGGTASESADCTRLHPSELEKLFLHDPDANLSEKLQLLLGANTSAMRQHIEATVIATTSASEDQVTQRTVFYQRVTAGMPAYIAAFINEEIRRRCAHIAPILCRELQLQPIPAPKVVRTVAEQRLLIQLGVLRPLFAKLATSASTSKLCETKRGQFQGILDKAGADLADLGTQDDDEIFADMDFLSTWSDDERQNLMAAVKGHIQNRPADEKGVEFVDWGEIEGGFDTHDDADCHTEFLRIVSTNAITRATKGMADIEVQLLSLQKRNKVLLQELSVADVPTTGSANIAWPRTTRR